MRLHRVAIGYLRLDNLPLGQYRSLRDSEVTYLRSLTDTSVDQQQYAEC